MSDHAVFAKRLEAWARAHYGPGAVVGGVRRMPGNSGISYGFDVEHLGEREALVVRLAPPGVARQGNADVMRQVPLLRAMKRAGLPVPGVRWFDADESWFGVPYHMVEHVRGQSTHLFDAGAAELVDGSGLEPVFAEAMGVLAAIHRVDWRRELAGWSTPRDLAGEIDSWTPSLLKSDDPRWIERGLRLRDRLVASMPKMAETSVVHGDFYSNNWLFAEGRLTAVLDWEIASIGCAGVDIGWICMMYDPRSWGPARHQWSRWSPSPEFLLGAYRAAGGPEVPDLAWFRALAGFRLSCITAMSLRLHRTGRRPDPAWEVLADASPYMLDRAEELLAREVR
ncbi:phosphotransferase family protein [Acrocarpospora macrocephala]|uniref:Aminoglycoside phosphotransferase n=1 Tax=Acrocarpospora macrocephala TaxID=150177 RepID=A0A5M3WYY6_9ACTN|nr:phosphotransferase family protein [Acrocarpospora macrocephala]GES13636.1 aminoglycoside phosphotransferase [Acrocarpospora macrocephala]